MKTEVRPATTATDTLSENERYKYAILHEDVESQQAQINELKTKFNDLEKRYETQSSTTEISPLGLSTDYWASQFSQHGHRRTHFLSQFTNVDYLTPVTPRSGTEERESLSAKDGSDDLGAKVSLHSLLKMTGAMMGATALASIAFWITGRPPLLNPFISLMTLVASPFAYAMGVAAGQR